MATPEKNTSTKSNGNGSASARAAEWGKQFIARKGEIIEELQTERSALLAQLEENTAALATMGVKVEAPTRAQGKGGGTEAIVTYLAANPGALVKATIAALDAQGFDKNATRATLARLVKTNKVTKNDEKRLWLVNAPAAPATPEVAAQ